MPKRLQFTNQFKDQAVRFVFESIEPTESRKEACRRLAWKVNVKEVTLYNWVKATTRVPGEGRLVRRSHVRSINCGCKSRYSKKENRELRSGESNFGSGSKFFWGGARPSIKQVTASVVAYRDTFGLEPICRVLQVSSSAVRFRLARPVSAHELCDESLKPKILGLFNDNYRVYGDAKSE